MNIPKLENRNEVHYVGIRTKATMLQLSTVIPQSHDEVLAWLKGKKINPCGPPFVRYYDVSEMDKEIDIEMGWPVEERLSGSNSIVASALPAGRYAVVLYRGDYVNLESETAKLLSWADERGVQWKMKGKEWVSRLEIYLTDPAEEPNAENWETELAFMIADEQ